MTKTESKIKSLEKALEAERKKHAEDVKSLRSEKNELKGQLKASTQKNDKLQAKNDELSKENKKLNAENKKKLRSGRKATEELFDLATRLLKDTPSRRK